ncbi:LOW QUALITY PROTEIN: ran-binding protein M homolog [Dioscorea cayenensis subsp. rotundata]|uniref:LOW QUALITY PROTEIN: ran-binding protein M homolog n=1 Tax=Dioscorea cayennensis subsp. rotundata TaxID=55577 RepID=A0AB40BCA7_DIOCR|nr:LOW QUALITY PROTEIN: ran-binding protein M homolog [Dioscorea cayenensis subsp. rotundata]
MVDGGAQEPRREVDFVDADRWIDIFQLSARWRSGPEWNAFLQELDKEQVPSHLNTCNSSGLFHVVSQDKLTVSYVGSQHHGHDVGIIQADCPVPTRRAAYYFEMTVKNSGVKGQTSIGFTHQQYKMRRQPGWETNSCGYHGDDGNLYRGQGKGEPFGPRFGTGDTVGSGINFISQVFFFTKNGELVGSVPKEIRSNLYPTVAVHSQNEEVTVNFGNQPFRFDVESFIAEERFKQQQIIEKLPLPANIGHKIVRSYLLHYGYQDTLDSFDMASENTFPPIPMAKDNALNEQGDIYALQHRKILRQFIKNGEIDSAFQKLREWYPQVLKDDMSAICFLLHSQRFIEYIRANNLECAVAYARAELAKFFANESFSHLLQEIVALLAYGDPSDSCVGYLLDADQREFVADAVNAVVLSTNPEIEDAKSVLQSRLEKLLRQLTVCSLLRRQLRSDEGEVFYLHRITE